MAIFVAYGVIAAAVIALDHKVTSWNVAPINGFGSIDYVVKRTAKTPVRHRVFLPWLFWVVFWMLGGENDPPERRPIYLFLKWAMAAAALCVAGCYLSPVVALSMAVFWLLTLQYDYWSTYPEALAFVLVLTGNVPLAIAGTVIGTLSKPTAIFLPFVFFSINGTWWAVLIAAVYAVTDWAVKRYQGDSERSEVMRKPLNCAFRFLWQNEKPKRYWLLFGWSVMAVSLVTAAHFGIMPNSLRETAWVPVAICASAFFGALVHEPRVMAVNAIWFGALLCG